MRSRFPAPIAGSAIRKSVMRMVAASESASWIACRSTSCGVATRVARSLFKDALPRRRSSARREAAARSTSGTTRLSTTENLLITRGALGDRRRDACRAGAQDAAALAREHLPCDGAEERGQLDRRGPLRPEARCEDRSAGEHVVVEPELCPVD